MSTTVKDVAKLAGVGQATISSYLNGGNVREKNKIKIEAAIKELDFHVNEIARGLKTNKTKTIGVIIPELNSNFYGEICMKLEDKFRKEGYAIIIADSRSNKHRENEAIDFLQKKRVDGLIIVPATNESSNIKKFISTGKPVVLLDRLLVSVGNCGSVIINNMSAAYIATEKLINAGHKNIGIIFGPEEVYTSVERKKGYIYALKKANIPVNNDLIIHGDYTLTHGITAMKSLIERNSYMTAVIFTNYDLTVGAIIALNELAINIPKDLAVVSFDSYDFAKAVTPNLNTIVQPLEEIAENATGQMLKRLAQAPHEWKSEIIQLNSDYIHGQSL
ncbi:MAG: LacI family DNA-binding transcriptional regulator [Lachnospirales bacterium]